MKKSMKQSTLILLLNSVSVLLLLFMVFSFLCYQNINRKIDTANSDRFELTYNANRFMNGSAYLTNEVRAYAATGMQQYYDNYWNEVNNLKNRDIGVSEMEKIGITAEEKEMIDEMSDISNTLVPLEENAMKNVQSGQSQKAIDYVYGEQYSSAIAKISALKMQFLETLDARAVAEINRLFFVRNVIMVCFVIALIFVGAMQVVTSIFTRLRIMRPIVQIRDEMGRIAAGQLSTPFAMEPNTSEIGMLTASILDTKKELRSYINDISEKLAQMAKGNMNVSVTADYRGEFLPIRTAMNEIMDSMNGALHQIGIAAEQVSAGSSQVASGAQTLSQGATEQASAVEELTATVDEISTQVTKTAQDAMTAKLAAEQASHELAAGNEQMEQLTTAMKDITEVSGKIGTIVKTIDDIAFQTNILALNAAVEAARAGVAGKGFAVVADEVRSLAGKSAEAAKDTTELIQNALQVVERGSELVAGTASVLTTIVGGASQSAVMIGGIAESSEKQSEALKQLLEGLDQISSVVQTNAATAEQSAASSQELSGQAEMLKASVHRFQLRG